MGIRKPIGHSIKNSTCTLLNVFWEFLRKWTKYKPLLSYCDLFSVHSSCLPSSFTPLHLLLYCQMELLIVSWTHTTVYCIWTLFILEYPFFQPFSFFLLYKILCLFSPALLRYNWHITLYKLKVYMWWFDTCLYFKMVATIRLVSVSITWHSHFSVCGCGEKIEDQIC